MKALVTASFSEKELARLREKAEVVHEGWGLTGDDMSTEQLINVAGDKEILIVELQEVESAVFANCPNLKVVGCCRGNPVNIDLAAATRYGIPVVNTPGRNAVAVAELTVALMINLARKIGPAYRNLKNGLWDIDDVMAFVYYKGIELYGKTIGLIGFGAIGIEVAKRLKAFGTKILVYDPYIPEDVLARYGVEKVSLQELLTRSRIISLHAAVTQETKGMIGKDEFCLLKPDTFLINTSRADLIDRAALVDALKNKRIAGVALDVFTEEPVAPEDELLKMENVFVTPHIGGATFEVEDHHARIVLDGIFTLLSGEIPKNIANPEVLSDACLARLKALGARSQ
ncbi:MAG TPA: 2-hydroxyacid dehydrogenase [Firmicutes bacterium]|jgi:phosphoglycerate dehydrogenase-like enzyme|nr:2-hydroxyacid dehydrogenase [Bacillota bacterium]